MRYLIFGATGNIGSRVTERLIARRKRLSVFVRNANKAKALFGHQVDIHVGDLDKPRSSLAAALAGIDEVFLVTDGPDLDSRDRAVAVAAKSAGVGTWSSSPRWTCTPAWGLDRGTRAARSLSAEVG